MDRSRNAKFCRAAAGWGAVLVLALTFRCASAEAEGPRRHFSLEAGDATATLNEFSQQADLQVLFDFNVLKGMKTHAVNGDYEASDALASMLAGTNLVFDFVNERTLAVTLARRNPSMLGRILQRLSSRPRDDLSPDELQQVLISTALESGTQPLPGAQTIQLTRVDIDRAGFATAQDFLRTLPQVFGGGPSEDTVLGREAGTNSGRGDGLNLRGLDAGSTLVLVDGRRIAPSGTEGAFQDISNIPLSAIDHIDILPDAAAARYGADAMGGVVNFVSRSNFSGAQSQARIGRVTSGSLGEDEVSQLFGTRWDGGGMALSLEYYRRDALPAQDRWQQTSNLTPFGGSNFNQPYGSPGTITNGIRFWPLPKGQNGTALTPGSLVAGAPNLYDQQEGDDVTAAQSRWSALGKADDRVSDSVRLFADGLISRRTVDNLAIATNPLVLTVPATNPFYVNPAGGTAPILVLYGTAADFGPPRTNTQVTTGNLDVGSDLGMAHGWSARGYVGYSFEIQHQTQYGLFNQAALTAALADPDPATAFNPFGDGSNTNPQTLDAIRRSARFDIHSRVTTLNLTADGPLLPLPGGDAHLTVGSEYRSQIFDTFTGDPDAAPDYDPRNSLGRRISAAFAELRIPVVGGENGYRFAKRVELSLGGRYEHYSDVGGATIPKLGLLWAPVGGLSLRGTWTKSFRPPNLPDVARGGSFNTLATLPDPASPTGLTTALIRYGTNPDLQAEHARSWTLGMDVSPASLPGASVSLTYFNIDYSGRIDNAALTPDVLERPDLAWLVNRNFTAAQLAAACAGGAFQGGGSCTGSAVGAIVDNRLRNIALLRTDGLDIIGKYAFTNSLGKLAFGMNATYIFDYSQANTPDSALLNVLNTQNHPINLRLTGSVAFDRRGFGISARLHYDNSYRDTLSVPNRNVSSWTTLDAQLAYETGGGGGSGGPDWLEHVRFSLNAQNVFDRHPPFLNNPLGVGYDQENADLLGRIVSFDVRKRW